MQQSAMMFRLLAFSWLCVFSKYSQAERTFADQPQRPYLARLADRVSHWQEQLPAMDPSADRAAENTIAGGNLYSFGPQHGFALEAVVRAGGLMLTKLYSDNIVLTERDTILTAVTGFESAEEQESLLQLIAKAEKAKAQVVLFGVVDPKEVGEFAPATLPYDSEAFTDDSSITSVSNVIAMWAWTGRYIHACVLQGSMPCIYQSHILPDGRLRTAALQKNDGGRFHKLSNVQVKDTDAIASRYLATIRSALEKLLFKEQASLERAADLLRTSREQKKSVAVYSLGHMFPGEFDQPQHPDWFVISEESAINPNVDTAIVLHYIAFPWETIGKIKSANLACILTCEQPALPAFTSMPSNVYVDPQWTIYDAAVQLANYDTHLLPASGVLDAAVYWQLVEWAKVSPE